MSDSEILIVGAGPVGLCLACELARYRVPFRLIEKRPEPSRNSKALGVHARSLEMLEDMGIAHKFVERGLPVQQINFYANGKRLTQVALSEVDSPFNFTLDIPQSLTERLYIEHLEQLGHQVDRYVELEGFENTENGVAVELRKTGGIIEKREYRYVVGCDGAHSTVRKHLGLEFKGDAYPEHFALADVHISSGLEANQMHMFFHSDGFLILFPMRGERYRVIATIADESEPTLDVPYIQELMNARTGVQTTVSDGIWFSNFRIHHRIVSQYRKGNVFLAGDAAHIHSPAGGQGMNTGMQDAYNLAWKLALNHEGLTDLLDSYSPERVPVGSKVVELTDRMTKVATMQNPVGTAVRNTMMPIVASLGVVQHKLVNTIEEVDVNYRGTDWVSEHMGDTRDASTRTPFSHGPKPGDRAPDAIVTQSETGSAKRLFELFQGPHYTLLVFIYGNLKEGEPKDILTLTQDLKKRLGKWIECYFISDRQVPTELGNGSDIYLDARMKAHSSYGVTLASSLYLVRPDGYVAFRSLPFSGKALGDYLDRIGLGAR
ncbi:MAG: FAD-dependent monooxygenase [Verrucomicrobiota bacterium]